MPKKKIIFFDAVGTLFDVTGGVGFQYSRLALQYGVRVDPNILDQRFREVFKRCPDLAFPGVTPSLLDQVEKAWWRCLVREVFEGIPFPHFDDFFEAVYSFFEKGKGDESPWMLFPETRDVLGHLTQLGHPMGIISNFDSRMGPVLVSLGIASFFQTITFSSQEGVAKPSVVIFHRALEKAGCNACDTLFIGDNPSIDGEGANAAGIPFLLIDREAKADIPSSRELTIPAHKTISSLWEVNQYI